MQHLRFSHCSPRVCPCVFCSLRNQFIIGLLIRGPLVHYWSVLPVQFGSVCPRVTARDCSLLPAVSTSSPALCTFRYEVLNKFVSSLGVSAKDQKGLPCVLGKVALDQLVFSPPYNLLYFHAIGLLEGTPSAVVQEKIAATFVPLMSQQHVTHNADALALRAI